MSMNSSNSSSSVESAKNFNSKEEDPFSSFQSPSSDPTLSSTPSKPEKVSSLFEACLAAGYEVSEEVTPSEPVFRNVDGNAPLFMYDPRCFIPKDERLQQILMGLLPTDPQSRLIGMDWLYQATLIEGTHWTEYVVPYLEHDYIIEDVEELFSAEPVLEEADLLVTNVLSVFEEEVLDDGFSTPDFFSFESDELVKCFECPEEYDIDSVAELLVGRNYNVVRLVGRKIGFYPNPSSIPNNMETLRKMSVNGFMPSVLRHYLIGYAIKRGKVLNNEVFFVGSFKDPAREPPEDLSSETLGFFEKAKKKGKPKISDSGGKPRKDPKLKNRRSDPGGDQKKFEGFSKFKEDIQDVSLPFSKGECSLDADDLNGLFDMEPSSLEVNGVMTPSIIKRMNGSVKRYLTRTGWFFLTGNDRYSLVYKLLFVSGAFNCLKRKFKDKRSTLVAMKIWLFRSSLVPRPLETKIEFISL
jgi:hypothetical protein